MIGMMFLGDALARLRVDLTTALTHLVGASASVEIFNAVGMTWTTAFNKCKWKTKTKTKTLVLALQARAMRTCIPFNHKVFTE